MKSACFWLAVALAVAVPCVWILRHPPERPLSSQAYERGVREVLARLDALEGRTTTLEHRTATLEARAAAPAVAQQPETIAAAAGEGGDIRPAVDAEIPPDGARGDGEAESEAFDLDAALDLITDRATENGERQQAWAEISRRGLLDQAITRLEEIARENPRAADAQADLGEGYLQRIFATSNDIEKGTWAWKADKAFDKALEADDHHWRARFAKAVSYSFYPPVMGMQPKAIEQFEILIEQQEASPAPEPRFADSYIFLGNLHANRGQPERAREVWSRGARFFPESKELAERAAAAPAGGTTSTEVDAGDQ